MSFLCLILSRLFVESTYCSATTKTYPFRKNDAIVLIESIEVFVATCPRSVRTEQSRRFRRYLFLRFYSLIYSRSLQSRYLTWCFASNTLTDEQGRVYHSLFSLLSLMTFYTKPQSDHPSLSKHDQVTAIAFLAQRPPNSHTLGADLAVSGVFTYPTFSPNTS